jgi:hypothetical protein
MRDREPAAWETNAAGPFLTLERPQGVVAVWALGADRFSIEAPEHKQVVAGYVAARATAHTLARQLGDYAGSSSSSDFGSK